MVKLFVILLLMCCSPFTLQAQTTLLPLTPEQGLSHRTVKDLLVDRHGFLWIATAGGINRFDGNKLTELHAQTHRLSEIAFNDILEDSLGRLWLSADHTGLYLYNAEAGTFELFIAAPREPGHPVESTILTLIEQDPDHLLFVVNQAIYRLKISDKNLTKIFDLETLGYPAGWIRHLMLQQQQLFIAAFNGVIHLDLNSGVHQYLPHLPAEITAPSEEQQHTKNLLMTDTHLYIGTVSGLYAIERQALQRFLQHGTPYQVQTVFAERNIWQLRQQLDELYIATDQGFYRYQAGMQAPQLILCFSTSNQTVSDNTIIAVATDNNGGFWLGNRSDGAYYWHPQTEAFASWSSRNGYALSHDSVNSLLSTADALWLATENGLNQFHPETGTVTPLLANPDPSRNLHQGRVRRVIALNDILWLETAEGIQGLNSRSGELLPLPVEIQDILGRGAHSLVQFQQSLLFVQRKQLYRYWPEQGKLQQLTLLTQTLPMDFFGDFLGSADNGESLLLSTADQLWRYTPAGEQIELIYQHPDYQPQLNRYATVMHLAPSGLLWLGIKGAGLFAFDPQTLEQQHHLSVHNKLRSDEILALITDPFGDLWFSSRQGLARVKIADLQVEYFNRADGLAFDDFNPQAVTQLKDGRLAFGGKQGVVLVDTSRLQRNQPPLRVVITDFAVLAGEQQELHGYLNNRVFNLSAKDTGLRINFSAMSFHQNHKLRYRYWLNGQSQSSYPEQSDSQVLFPQLSPGRYQFNVVAISPLTGAQSEPASLYLTIQPPLWRSVPALLIYTVLSALLLAWFLRRRRQQHAVLQQAHQQVSISEQRLNQALSSVNSGAFEWLASSNTLESSRLPRMLGTSELMQRITYQQHCSLIHPDDIANFELQWQKVLEQPGQMLDVTYRMRHQDGRWLWFRDRGRVTEFSAEQQALKLLGTYSNITETKANEEKARLFGEAFQQTRDWVVILDTRQRVLAANQSFCQAFGGIEPYLDSPRVHHLGISLVRRRFYTQLLKTMVKGDHWQGEEQVITPDGRERPTLINVSAVGEQGVSFYVLVFTDITAQKEAEDELRYLANYDALTGLPNRALLMDRIIHGIEKAKREKRSLALCFIDLDKFKHINDSLGHDIGDLMLKEVARRLKLTLRDSDTVARLGGDEFVVLLEGYKNNDNISHVARKMLATISEPMQLGSDSVAVSPSIGIAIYPDDALNGTELMKHADVAMYHAKEAGRNNFQFFIKEMNEKAHMQLARETRLRKAIQRQEFINYYQPIIDSREQSIVGVEVLLRWQSSDGMISPAEFIPLAEELRLIVEMTQQLLERALYDMQQWRRAGMNLYLSVNLTTQHLEQPALAESVLALLDKYQLPTVALRFEITESALMRDQQSAIRTMQALSDAGIKLALDDFGTGYSSLKYLKELPLDAIKIDRSFVQDIGIDHNDETIIDAMLGMAGSLGMYCVAEGVETEQQLAFFNKRDCYLIQGFLFSKPLPAAELLALLQSEQFAPTSNRDNDNWQV